MKKNLNKRALCLLFSGVMCMSMLVGCSNTTKTENGSSELNNSVVAVMDGKEITRESVGTNLLSAEQEVIAQYIKSELLANFFKDAKVTDEEVALQMELMKSQVGEESWPTYLVYYGGGDEETFKTTLKQSLKQEKYIAEKAKNITVTDEELAEVYNQNPDSYNIAVLDVIFFPDEETFNKGVTLLNEGKTLEEISKSVDISISENEHTYYNSENITWSKSFSESKIGDIVRTDNTSGTLVIGCVKTLNEGLSNSVVKEDIISNIKYEKAYEETEHEFIHVLIDTKVEIMGQPYVLYDGEHTHTGGE